MARSGGLRFLSPTSFLAIALYLCLRAIAHAHPPDPLTVRGMYDAADLDELREAVRLLVSPEIGRAVTMTRAHAVAWVIARSEPFALVAAPIGTVHPRAPPTAY